MVCAKVRIRFKKTGELRLISHHDLMRCFERMLRRASLPYHSTAGFNPKPRLVFAMPLSLGVVGLQEIAELELDEELTPEEIQARLTAQAPAGLDILSVHRIDPKITAHVRKAVYQVSVPPESVAGLPECIEQLLAAAESWIERDRPEKRRINLRPYLSDLRLFPGRLEIDLLVTPNGTARPEEILRLLGLGDLLAAGAILERSHLELEEEARTSGVASAPRVLCVSPTAGVDATPLGRAD
jgi:radical SAM-linked protein